MPKYVISTELLQFNLEAAIHRWNPGMPFTCEPLPAIEESRAAERRGCDREPSDIICPRADADGDRYWTINVGHMFEEIWVDESQLDRIATLLAEIFTPTTMEAEVLADAVKTAQAHRAVLELIASTTCLHEGGYEMSDLEVVQQNLDRLKEIHG